MRFKSGRKGKGKKTHPKRFTRRKKQAVAGIVLFASLALSLASFQFFFPSSASDFQLDTARNGPVRLSELKGTNVILVFFRSTG